MFEKKWLPGQDSNLQPIGYKGPGISPGLGLSLHPFPLLGRTRVSGASPAPYGRTRIGGGVRARALVSAPSPPIRRTGKAWLRITLSATAEGGLP